MTDIKGLATSAPLRVGVQTVSGRVADAAVGFEAALLQVLIEQTLPKGSTIFGSGTAGDVARSRLSEELSSILARQDLLGLSRHIEDVLLRQRQLK